MSEAVITGIGAVTGRFDDVGTLWTELLTPGPVPIPSSRSGTVADWADTALREAIGDAGLAPEEIARSGLVVGTTLGVVERWELPDPVPGSGPYDLAAGLAAGSGVTGPVHSVSTACSSGAHALGLAVDLLAGGVAERVLVCGADRRSVVSTAMLDRLDMLDPQVCRPLDAGRDGMVPGEGAAALVVESPQAAARRGAPVHARVEAECWSSDAHHAVAADPDGTQLRHAVHHVLREVDIAPAAVVPHRAGVAANDHIETTAIADVLGPAARDVPVYGVKAVLGHTAGAAAVFACLVATLMLRHGVVPPNRNVTAPDPGCPLPIPRDGAVPLARPRVLVTATGFGGSNAAILLGAP